MKGSMLYFLLSALLLSTAFSVVYTQINKQKTKSDELFI
jgi:CHASE3 domain sensor protein